MIVSHCNLQLPFAIQTISHIRTCPDRCIISTPSPINEQLRGKVTLVPARARHPRLPHPGVREELQGLRDDAAREALQPDQELLPQQQAGLLSCAFAACCKEQ